MIISSESGQQICLLVSEQSTVRGYRLDCKALQSDRLFSPSGAPSRWSLRDVSLSREDLLSVRMTMWSADGVSLLTKLVTSRMAISFALRLVVGEQTRGE